MLRLRALTLFLATTCLTLSLARYPTRDAICSVCQKLRCKPTIEDGSGKDNEGMKHRAKADAGEPMPMGSSSDEDQQSHWSDDQENQDEKDNPPSASDEHNLPIVQDKRSKEGKEWNLFPLRNTTGAWLFGK